MLQIITIPRPRRYPPRVSAFTRPFWDALAEGRLQTTQCEACGKFSFPPKPFCPHCWHKQVRWAPLAGSGRLYAATTIHAAPTIFRDDIPYSVGIVDLDEGLRLACRLQGAVPPLDSPVRLVVLEHSDGPLYAAVAA